MLNWKKMILGAIFASTCTHTAGAQVPVDVTQPLAPPVVPVMVAPAAPDVTVPVAPTITPASTTGTPTPAPVVVAPVTQPVPVPVQTPPQVLQPVTSPAVMPLTQNQNTTPKPVMNDSSTSGSIPITSNSSPVSSNAVPVTVNPANGTGMPNLSIKFTSPESLAPGQSVVIEVSVTNTGTRAAENVSVSGWWTDGYTLTESSVTSYTMNGRKAWGMGAIGIGETRSFKIKLTPAPNVQPVEFRHGFDATFSSAVSDTRSIRVLKPEYTVQVVAAENVIVGQTASMMVKVTNKGQIDIDQMSINVILPEFVTHPNGTKLGTQVPKLVRGATETIPLALNVTRTGEGKAKVIVTATGGEPQEHEIQINAVDAKMAVSIHGPRSTHKDWPITFEATIENQSRVPVKGSMLEVKLPNGLSDLRASGNAQGGRDAHGHRVVWTFDTLQPGEKRTVYWFGFAKQTEDLITNATISIGNTALNRSEWTTRNAGSEKK